MIDSYAAACNVKRSFVWCFPVLHGADVATWMHIPARGGKRSEGGLLDVCRLKLDLSGAIRYWFTKFGISHPRLSLRQRHGRHVFPSLLIRIHRTIARPFLSRYAGQRASQFLSCYLSLASVLVRQDSGRYRQFGYPHIRTLFRHLLSVPLLSILYPSLSLLTFT